MLEQKMKEIFCERLKEIYDQRELENIWKIYTEDVLNVIDDETALTQQFKADLVKFEAAIPLQYITGLADFYGHQFKVDSSVLIPRPETEELVYWISEEIKDTQKPLNILDIGTGSGCIIASLAKQFWMHNYYAVDFSNTALKTAQSNFEKLEVEVDTHFLDILDPAQWSELEKMDVIISNPPYIKVDDSKILSDNVLKHEPHMALFAGPDPLVFYKAIEQFARYNNQWKVKVFLEINEFLKDETQKLYQNSFKQLEIKKDMQNQWRMLYAKDLKL